VLERQRLDVNTVVGGFEKVMRRVIGEDVLLKMALCEEAVRVTADPSQLEQVLMNLAVNARDAMPQGGTLTIETGMVELDADDLPKKPGIDPGPYAMIAVSDTGVGMDSETLTQIFEPFFTTKESDRGTGLGLATSYGILK
jgi:signal transduction histidine kinase